MDPIVVLKDIIRKVLASFFDIEKAYDMAWKHWLLIKMHQMGVMGRMLQWVK